MTQTSLQPFSIFVNEVSDKYRLNSNLPFIATVMCGSSAICEVDSWRGCPAVQFFKHDVLVCYSCPASGRGVATQQRHLCQLLSG